MIQNIRKSADNEIISGSITAGSSIVTIASYYRPPNRTDSEYLTNSADDINTLRVSAKNQLLLSGGGGSSILQTLIEINLPLQVHNIPPKLARHSSTLGLITFLNTLSTFQPKRIKL